MCCLRPAGLSVPPRVAGCRGDAVLGGADEPSAGRWGQGCPLEAAGQLRYWTEQCGGRVRTEVRVHTQECMHTHTSIDLENCTFCHLQLIWAIKMYFGGL